jgi:hypothetical protein
MMRETIQMNLPATRGITTADRACRITYHLFTDKYRTRWFAKQMKVKQIFLQTEL